MRFLGVLFLAIFGTACSWGFAYTAQHDGATHTGTYVLAAVIITLVSFFWVAGGNDGKPQAIQKSKNGKVHDVFREKLDGKLEGSLGLQDTEGQDTTE